jgi:hypothetical protein
VWRRGRGTQGAPTYKLGNVPPGPHKIALTRILLADQRFCHAFFEYAPLVEDMQRREAMPFWNGALARSLWEATLPLCLLNLHRMLSKARPFWDSRARLPLTWLLRVASIYLVVCLSNPAAGWTVRQSTQWSALRGCFPRGCHVLLHQARTSSCRWLATR